MLKAFIIALSLLSLGLSEGIHCADEGADFTYSTRYIIPETNAHVNVGSGGQDNFLTIQKYLHTYYSVSSAQT